MLTPDEVKPLVEFDLGVSNSFQWGFLERISPLIVRRVLLRSGVKISPGGRSFQWDRLFATNPRF